MKRKVKEQIFNEFGVLTASQRKKIKAIGSLEKLPIVNDQMRTKQAHQLTLREYTAIYSRNIVEEAAPQLLDKSMQCIFESVSAAALQRMISRSLSTAKANYFRVILAALEQKLPGIPEQTISEIRFRNNFFNPTRSYLNFYKNEYKSIMR